MTLILCSPQVAFRDCKQCQKYEYNEETGKIELFDGKNIFRRGETPCRTSRGCPKGTPEQPRTLSRRNQLAYLAYLRWKAVGRFPDDPQVEYNAAVIRQAEEVADQQREHQLAMLGKVRPPL